jgi:nuclear pore complex protein Nup93
MSPQVSTPQLSAGSTAMAIVPASDKTITEKKASLYAETVRDLNEARSRKLPFKVSS